MSEPFIGEIRLFGFNFPPRGWARCDGQLLSIASNTALFSLLGTFYGGDGRNTFGLPDLRGRAALHMGTGPGLSPRSIGQKGGTESNTLTASNMPAHNHPAAARSGAGNSNVADGNVWAMDAGVQSATYHSGTPDGAMSPDAIGFAGSGTPVDNMPPYLALNYCIALVGIYPPRS